MIDVRSRASEATGLESRNHAVAILATGVILAVLYWARAIFITAAVAVIIALILQPFVALLMRLKLPRSVAAFVVCLLALLVLCLVGAAAYNQITGLSAEVPAFKERFGNMVEDVNTRLQAIEDATARFVMPRQSTPPALPQVPEQVRSRRRKAAPRPAAAPPPPGQIQEVRIHQDTNPVINYIYSRLSTLYEFMLMASFVPFLVYFMLSWQDHIYRSFLRFFEDGPARMTASRSMQGIAGMARAFVVGNFMIGVVAAAIGSAAFAAIHLPFPLVAGVLSGFLTLFPYIGLVLAIAPPALAAVAGGVPTTVVLAAAAIAGGIHLIVMNLLFPKLVGARVHLNPLVVTFSLMIFGFLWSAAGLVLAIPITAGIKAVCDNVSGLRPYGRFLGD